VDTTLIDAIANGADSFGDQPFLSETSSAGSRTIGFDVFERRCNAIARGLIDRGLAVGTHVSVAEGSGLDRVILEFGIVLAGGVLEVNGGGTGDSEVVVDASEQSALLESGERPNVEIAREIAERHRSLRPDATCMVAGGETWSHARLHESARATVSQLGGAYGPRIATGTEITGPGWWTTALIPALVTGGVVTMFDSTENLAKYVVEQSPEACVISKADEETLASEVERFNNERNHPARRRWFGARVRRRSGKPAGDSTRILMIRE
jgi:hypothetical protein